MHRQVKGAERIAEKWARRFFRTGGRAWQVEIWLGLVMIIAAAISPAPARAGVPPASCSAPDGAVAILWIDPFEAHPGQQVPVAPQWTSRPGDFDDIPQSCWHGTSVPRGAHATVSSDGTSVYISSSARDGEQVPVFVWVGEHQIRGIIRVTVADYHPLAGRWVERAFRCGPKSVVLKHDPVKELVLAADGSFSVTWHPFETYRDYWGRYEYDRDLRHIFFKVESGNQVPKMLKLNGRFRLTDANQRLTLSGVSFGEPDREAVPQTCEIEFGR